MRYSTLFTPALALVCASSAFASEDGAPSDVLTVTATDFDQVVNPEPLILVEFFAPWCGHCKALAPHYEEAATTLKEKNIKIAKVDCVDQADLCQANGISGYPTLRVYRNGTPSDYTGPRKADGIVSYMTKQSLPAVSPLTAETFPEFSKSEKIVAVAFAAEDDKLTAEFAAAAERHRDDFLFGQVSDAAAAKAEGVTPPAVVVYRSFDEPKTVYSGDVNGADIGIWVNSLSVPVLAEVSGENYATYASSDKPLAYLFVDPTEDNAATLDGILPIATEFKDKMNFVWIDARKFADHGKALNLHEAKWPSFVIQDLKTQLKYPMEQNGAVDSAAAKAMVQQYLSGALAPSLKSAPIPETQDEPVFTLVGKQFDEVIFDDSKDVFVEFYATWCGHCKRLKPIWDQLGEHFAGVKDRVSIVKMEATENDLPPSAPFQVSGFPTLKFKPAGTKEFIDYGGDRTLESLIAFVEEQAKNDLKAESKPSESVAVPKTEETPVEKHDEL